MFSTQEPGRAAFYVVVEHGQSLQRIAQTYRVRMRDIIAANNLAPPYSLPPGTLLEVAIDAATRAAHAAKSRSKRDLAAKASAKRYQTAKAAIDPAKRVKNARAWPMMSVMTSRA